MRVPAKKTCLVGALLALSAPLATAADAPPAATSIAGAVTGGKAQLSLRLRHETVDDDAFARDASALTLRTRLGWQSAPFAGVSATLEVDDVRALVERYNSTSNGRTTRPIVGDPEGTELNRASLQWQVGPHTLAGGRQRIVFDDHRFIGNVGWRQNEQTFDSVSFRTTALPRIELGYAWIWNVNRVFGPKEGAQQANWRGATHLINAKFNAGAAGTISAFAYLLDFDNAAAQSNATYGLRWSGGPEIAQGWKIPFALSYATQRDHAANPVDYRADYWLAEIGIAHGPWTLKVGRETLEGDAARPNARFITPLATLHAFQGWVDKFLVTPPRGIEDTWVGLQAKLGPANCQLWWHDFRAEAGKLKYGTEWNAAVGMTLAQRYELLLKAGRYDADGFGSDATKLWLMASATF